MASLPAFSINDRLSCCEADNVELEDFFLANMAFTSLYNGLLEKQSPDNYIAENSGDVNLRQGRMVLSARSRVQGSGPDKTKLVLPEFRYLLTAGLGSVFLYRGFYTLSRKVKRGGGKRVFYQAVV